MEDRRLSQDFLGLLNEATAREMQVSMQYMMQHALYSGGGPVIDGSQIDSKAGKFVASHSPFFFPGITLKKIAITEMRHAEAIAERVSFLGGETFTQPKSFMIGKTVKEILELDKLEEEGAIKLYNQIISVAHASGDGVTESLFRRILLDEQEHHRVFASLILE